jgi:hypothetical protein
MRNAIFLLMGVGVMAALSAVMASGALAVNTCVAESEALTFRVCLYLSETELELLEAATFAVLQEEKSSRAPEPELSIKFATPAVVVCLEGEADMGVEVELMSEANLKFTECTVVTPEHCAIAGGAITVSPLFGTAKVVSGTVDVLFVPQSGTTFATFTIGPSGGICIDAQEDDKITGEDLCTFLEPIQTPEPEHFLECTPEGSRLKFASSEVTLLDEWSVLMVEPTDDASWSIVEGL